MKKVCVVIGSRANYASIKSAMKAIKEHPELYLMVVAMASAVLDRYGTTSDVLKQDGFPPDVSLHCLVEGETLETMSKSTGLALIDLSTVFNSLKPDVVVTVGDRYETMATTLAAAYMNIPIAHTMGGEVTGTIDESIRHAVTKFSHMHFPATHAARERIIKLGEKSENVFMVGCPRMDTILEAIAKHSNEPPERIFETGVGEKIDTNKPYIIVAQHPVTTEYGDSSSQMNETLKALAEIDCQAIVMWPNADAGASELSREIRRFREFGNASRMHFFKNMPLEDFATLMKHAACIVGNSSSGIRDASFIGTPSVNLGSRQDGRERSDNVLSVDNNKEQIISAIKTQLVHGPYAPSQLYGKGDAGIRIADIIASTNVSIQKRIEY